VLIDMSRAKDNLPTNRQRLLSIIAKFVDVADDRTRETVFRAIEPLARGDGIAPPEQPSDAANAIGGDPKDVQAAALVALAEFVDTNRSRSRRVNQILFEVLVDPNENIRRAGYVAASRLSEISAEGMLAILNGLRDPDPLAARSAFQAFAKHAGSKVTRPMWRIFLLGVRFASQSPNMGLRHQAAIAIRKHLSNVPTAEMKCEGERILDAFRADIAFGVWRVAILPMPGGETG
jgi:hypothetical protein